MACVCALHTRDVLLAVFDQMPCYGDTYDRLNEGDVIFYQSNRQTMSRLARVCKMFADPALQSLWRTLDSMKPLLGVLTCFKRVVVETEDFRDSDVDSDDEYDLDHQFVWVLQGDVCLSEWERLRQYAKRVHSLRHHYMDAIDSSVLSFLSHCQQGDPILPQLRKLHWSQRSGDDLTVFPLVSPSLQDLSLEFCDGGRYGRSTRRECVLESILRYIPLKAAAVESLSVRGITQANSLLPLVACHHLRRLHLHSAVRMMDAPSFNILAGMANLSDLHISIEDVEVMPESLREGFSRLESLSLQAGQQIILSFLQAISPPLLRSISLKYRDIWGPEGRDDSLGPDSCRKAMMSLALCTKFPALRRLVVQCSPWVPRLYLEGASFAFIDLIRPLFVMGQLEGIHLQFETLAMHLPDADFYELTSAWPRMKVFTLHCNIDRGGLPSMSALVPFAQRWPDLKTLALPSVGCGESDTLVPEAFPITSHGLRELTFQQRPGIADRDTFIPTLHRLFPSLDTTPRLDSFCRPFGPNNI